MVVRAAAVVEGSRVVVVVAGSVVVVVSAPEVVAAAVDVGAAVGCVTVVGGSETTAAPDVHALSVMTPRTMTVATRVRAAILSGPFDREHLVPE